MIVTISKGLQITIPSEIRNELGLEIGSKVELEKRANKIIIKPIEDDLERLFEEAKRIKPKHKLSAKDMDKMVEDEILG